MRLREELRIKNAERKKRSGRDSVATTRQGSRPSSALMEHQPGKNYKTSRNGRVSPITSRNSALLESTASMHSLKRSHST